MAAAASIAIDGALMEGGGQILRMSTAFSCLTKQPIVINNIRANRSKPGLRPQHLSGMRLIGDLCNGKLVGAEEGSCSISLTPGHTSKGSYEANTHTAGSICLLLQVSLPVMLFADGTVHATFKGGTNADFAPQIDYSLMSHGMMLQYLAIDGNGDGTVHATFKGGTNAEFAPQIDYSLMVFQPIAERLGIKFDVDIIKRGYFPKGGGTVMVSCDPVKCIKPLNLTDPGHLVTISGRAFVAGVLPIKIAETLSKTATHILQKKFPKVPVKIEVVHESEEAAFGNGTGIMIVAETSTGCLLAGSGLGKRGVPAEKIAKDAAESLIEELMHGGCVDEYLQDQLILFMALAEGKSKLLSGPVSLHTSTAIHIAEKMTKAKFTVTPVPGKDRCFMIECQGIGLENQSMES